MRDRMFYTAQSKGHDSMIDSWGARLRKAMGDKEILSRNCFKGGELRVPTYRSYAEALDRNPWMVYSSGGRLYIQPYNTLYDGWDNGEHRSGLMACSMNSYEYAYKYWDEWTNIYSPNLLDSGTFGTWLELLPEPAFVIIENNSAIIRWSTNEPRVHRCKEMGRYQLPESECIEVADESHWRVSRAEAYVKAWEKMAANEPEDRHEADILADQEQWDKKWGQGRE